MLASIFALFAAFSGVQMIWGKVPKATRELPGTLGLIGAGTGIGILSGMIGAGGAFVTVPYLERCNVRIHNAVATSAALGLPIAASGTFGFILTGSAAVGIARAQPGLRLPSGAAVHRRRRACCSRRSAQDWRIAGR